jgi:outer membrane receptor protein involved in Fe transport
MISRVKQWALAGVATATVAGAFAQRVVAQETPATALRRLDAAEEAYQSADEQRKRALALQTIVVTGTNLKDVKPESIPVSVYTAEDIKNLGAFDIQEFIRLVPQNLTSRTTDSTPNAPTSNFAGVSGFDLRGLGPSSTLTLINGHRLSQADGLGLPADISLIPLAALDRVEILTDGASSIYGSDAVAGVVNFITRKDYQGAETNLQYESTTDGGGYELGRVDQTLGTAWRTGGVMGTLSYSTASPLIGTDKLYIPTARRADYLSPAEQRYNAFLTGRQDITEKLSVFGDFLYSQRILKSLGFGAPVTPVHSKTDQYFGSGGGRYQISRDLGFEADVSYTHLHNAPHSGVTFLDAGNLTTSSLDASGKFNGNLVKLWNGSTIKYVVGGGDLRETFEEPNVSLPEKTRDTTYAFGEVDIPAVSPQQKIPLITYLDVNLSGRYTSIENVGDKFNPKAGFAWALTTDVKVRGTYSESFRAPTLYNLNAGHGTVVLAAPGDHVTGVPGVSPAPVVAAPAGSPPGTLILAAFAGGNSLLKPETSTNYTAGFDITPHTLPGFKASVTYWNINFTDRVQALTTQVLQDIFVPATFPDIINTSPTEAEIASIIAAGSAGGLIARTSHAAPAVSLTDPAALAGVVTVIEDGRYQNLAKSRTDGLDFSIDYSGSTPVGQVSVGGVATYTFNLKQQLGSSGALTDLLATYLEPTDFRGRAYLGFEHGPWSARANVNYVNGYHATTLPGAAKFGSWTTVDLLAGYEFKSVGPLGALKITADVRNLLNEDPPTITPSGATGLLGFDPANADAFGRTAGIKVTQTW